jgi:hypothetical protein
VRQWFVRRLFYQQTHGLTGHALLIGGLGVDLCLTDRCPIEYGHQLGSGGAVLGGYAIACICAYFLKTINPNSSWLHRFKALAATFPNSTIVNIGSAGFPVDWDKANLWA